MDRVTLVGSIDQFLERHKMSETHFGVLAAKDHGFVGKLRAGKANPGLKRIERITTFISVEDERRAGAK